MDFIFLFEPKAADNSENWEFYQVKRRCVFPLLSEGGQWFIAFPNKLLLKKGNNPIFRITNYLKSEICTLK